VAFFSIQPSYKHPSGLLILLRPMHISKDAHMCYLFMAEFVAQSDLRNTIFSYDAMKVCSFGQMKNTLKILCKTNCI
jgi:hypothetical protein